LAVLIGFSLGISNHFKIFSSKLSEKYQSYQLVIISFGHVTLYAITGSQQAIASKIDNPKVSVLDGKTYTSLHDKYSTNSSHTLYQTNLASLYFFSNLSFSGQSHIINFVQGKFNFRKSSILFSIATLHMYVKIGFLNHKSTFSILLNFLVSTHSGHTFTFLNHLFSKSTFNDSVATNNFFVFL
jgi:hypothetical protein